jgi:hypothetical protein
MVRHAVILGLEATRPRWKRMRLVDYSVLGNRDVSGQAGRFSWYMPRRRVVCRKAGSLGDIGRQSGRPKLSRAERECR